MALLEKQNASTAASADGQTLLEDWFCQAKRKLNDGTLTASDLDELHRRLTRGQPRQRLMYICLTSPNPASAAVSCAIHEPTGDAPPEIRADEVSLPYNSVIEALRDGWQVLQAPDPRAPFDDDDMDLLGYEFILQKMERYDADR